MAKVSEQTHSGCTTCAKACDDAKQKVKQLEKSLHTMTIVMSVSLTLAGEQIIKNAASYISSFSSVVSSAKELQKTQLEETKEEEKVEEKNKQALAPFQKLQFANISKKKIEQNEQTRPYRLEDEIARFEDEIKPEEPILVKETQQVKINAAQLITKNIVPQDFVPAIQAINPDMHTFFFTPSALPFDEYSTTIALGTNYGFGEYYGIETGFYPPQNNVTSVGTLTLFAIPQLFSTRKRV